MSTDESQRALLMEDIAAIRTAAALKFWGTRWSDVICRLPAEMKQELREAYQKRMEELK